MTVCCLARPTGCVITKTNNAHGAFTWSSTNFSARIVLWKRELLGDLAVEFPVVRLQGGALHEVVQRGV